jgi:hypothetical protein
VTLRRAIIGALVVALAAPLGAQGYRLRLDTRVQAVDYRGISADSILATDVVAAPGGGTETPDGFAVSCTQGFRYCYYIRPGERLRARPVTGTGDLTLWGLGVAGLTVHASARFAGNLGNQVDYPLTEPGVTLLEGYVEYARSSLVGRAGRQIVTGRLGYEGFDGALAKWRQALPGVEATGYAGWGLGRAAALAVTSPALNPLDDFQPRNRQLVFGGEVAFRRGWVDARAEYRREIDPSPDYLVSERAAASMSLSPLAGWSVVAGTEYDFANGWWGSADASVNYVGRHFYATAGAKRYRPFFDLWTVWGAFSPVPYSAVTGVAAVQPFTKLWLRASGERYRFEPAEASTALVTVEDRGWRASLGATAQVTDRLTIDAGLRGDFGPGAASRSVEGSAAWQVRDRITLTAQAATLDRPLEFRFDESNVQWYSVGADVRLGRDWRWVSDLARMSERRDRPDPATLDWGQLRVSTRLVLSVGSNADRLPPGRLPPGRPRPAGDGR